MHSVFLIRVCDGRAVLILTRSNRNPCRKTRRRRRLGIRPKSYGIPSSLYRMVVPCLDETLETSPNNYETQIYSARSDFWIYDRRWIRRDDSVRDDAAAANQ